MMKPLAALSDATLFKSDPIQVSPLASRAGSKDLSLELRSGNMSGAVFEIFSEGVGSRGRVGMVLCLKNIVADSFVS